MKHFSQHILLFIIVFVMKDPLIARYLLVEIDPARMYRPLPEGYRKNRFLPAVFGDISSNIIFTHYYKRNLFIFQRKELRRSTARIFIPSLNRDV